MGTPRAAQSDRSPALRARAGAGKTATGKHAWDNVEGRARIRKPGSGMLSFVRRLWGIWCLTYTVNKGQAAMQLRRYGTSITVCLVCVARPGNMTSWSQGCLRCFSLCTLWRMLSRQSLLCDDAAIPVPRRSPCNTSKSPPRRFILGLWDAGDWEHICLIPVFALSHYSLSKARQSIARTASYSVHLDDTHNQSPSRYK